MDALEAGAHVIVEKPATADPRRARGADRAAAPSAGRAVVEDYNYLFNRAPREILRRIEIGRVRRGRPRRRARSASTSSAPSGFADPNSPHPCLSLAGGAIADFLPHLASLAHLFVGAAPAGARGLDEAQAVRPAVRRVPRRGRSASAGRRRSASAPAAQPDGFWLRVYGERMQATANLFETRLTFDRVRAGPKPLRPLLNGFDERRGRSRGAAVGSLLRKFSGGPGAYEGLFELLARTYRALADGSRAAGAGAASPRSESAGRRPQSRRRRATSSHERRWSPAPTVSSGGTSCRALLRARAQRARPGPAGDAGRCSWVAASVEVFRADLRSTRDLEPAFDDVDVLVHLAASVAGGEEEQFAVNGRRHRAAARPRWRASSCRRLVLASSFCRLRLEPHIRRTLDETSPLEPSPDLYERDGYSIAKPGRSAITRRFAEQHGWELTVLRPGFIWGRDHAYLAALGQQVGPIHLVIGPRAAHADDPRRELRGLCSRSPPSIRAPAVRPSTSSTARASASGASWAQLSPRHGRARRAHSDSVRARACARPRGLRDRLQAQPASCRRSSSPAASSRGSSRSATRTGARASSSAGSRPSTSPNAWRGPTARHPRRERARSGRRGRARRIARNAF